MTLLKKITDNNKIEQLFQQEVGQNTRKKSSQQELSEAVMEEIEELSAQCSGLFDEENYSAAIKIWREPLALITHPQNCFSESLWLEASIADAYFLTGDFENSLLHFENAKNNILENANENSFIMLRSAKTILKPLHRKKHKNSYCGLICLKGRRYSNTRRANILNS